MSNAILCPWILSSRGEDSKTHPKNVRTAKVKAPVFLELIEYIPEEEDLERLVVLGQNDQETRSSEIVINRECLVEILKKLAYQSVHGFRFTTTKVLGYAKSRTLVQKANEETLRNVVTFLYKHAPHTLMQKHAEVVNDGPDGLHPKTTKNFVSWRDLKKACLKNDALGTFFEDMIHKYSLNPMEARDMRFIVTSSLSMKIIDHRHITVRDKKIVSIEGLEFDPQTREFLHSWPLPQIIGGRPHNMPNLLMGSVTETSLSEA